MKDNVAIVDRDTIGFDFHTRFGTRPTPGVLSRFNSKHPNQVKVAGWDYSEKEIYNSPLSDEPYWINARENDRPAAMFYAIAGAGDYVDLDAMMDDKLEGPGETTEWQDCLMRCQKTTPQFFVPPECMLGFVVPAYSSFIRTEPTRMRPGTEDEESIAQRAKGKLYNDNELGFEFLPYTEIRVEPGYHGYHPYATKERLAAEKHTEQINARSRVMYKAWLEHAVSVALHSVAQRTGAYICMILTYNRLLVRLFVCVCLTRSTASLTGVSTCSPVACRPSSCASCARRI